MPLPSRFDMAHVLLGCLFDPKRLPAFGYFPHAVNGASAWNKTTMVMICQTQVM